MKDKKTRTKSKDYTQTAYKGIREMMFYKEIGPGQKISCLDLAERLNMSPTPIVQALKLLQVQGLVRHEPNRGYYTEPLDIDEVREIYELRETIEVSLVAEAIKHLDKEEEQKLRRALDALRDSPREAHLKDRLSKDIDYHMTLASLARKPFYYRMLRLLLDILSLKYRGNYLMISNHRSSDEEHVEIFEKVIAKNTMGAQEAVSKHITNVKLQVIKELQEMLAEREYLFRLRS